MTNVTRLFHRQGTLRYHDSGPPDERNDPTDTWTDVPVRCSLQMRARQEIAPEGEISATTWLAMFEPGITPPKAADELVIDGVTYQFRGDSWLAMGTRGTFDHIEATMELAV